MFNEDYNELSALKMQKGDSSFMNIVVFYCHSNMLVIHLMNLNARTLNISLFYALIVFLNK